MAFGTTILNGRKLSKMVILFDLDGTLIDSTEAILESFAHAYSLHNVTKPSDEAIKSLIGHPLDVMFQRLGIKEALAWEMVDSYKAHYRKISKEKTQLLQGAFRAVELASSFAQLGVVTTKTAKYSKELLEHFELLQYFKILIGREDVTHPKPHPEPILKALKHFTSSEDDVYMIGDTRLDIEASNRANIGHVAVLTGYDSYEQLKEITTTIVSNATEAVKYLQNKKK